MIIAKTRDTILSDITARLKQLGIEPLSVGITQGMINGVVDILYAAEEDRIAVDSETNPTLATGSKLENIAFREFGIQRILGSTSSDLTYTNFHFYLSGSATAKDITTDSAGFTIPANIFVRDAAGNLFMTTRSAVFDKSSNTAFVPITSINPVIGDIVSLALTQHEYNILDTENITTTSLGSTTLLCTNLKTIPGSSNNETDDSLRLRVQMRANSLNQSNEERLRGILTSIPGIVGVDFRKNKRGNGSVECILQTQLSNPSEGIYTQAEGLIKQNIYGADNIFVVKPQYIPLRITLKLIAQGVIENIAEVKSAISVAATDYVNNSITQGGTFVLSDFLLAMKAVVSGIERIDLDCLYVNNRKAVIQDQVSFYNQKFVVMSPLDIVVK